MRKASVQARPTASSAKPGAGHVDGISPDEPPIVHTDGGSGLYDACVARFAPPRYRVVCDARHTVWVKAADGARSMGLSPWLLREYSLDEVLERVARKLEPPVPAC